jgi:hypothetical protein
MMQPIKTKQDVRYTAIGATLARFVVMHRTDIERTDRRPCAKLIRG